jgi:hypothetical protein
VTLDRAEAERLLNELAAKLHEDGVIVTIHIVGGAAVMLTARPDRTATVDVDSWINCGADEDTHAKVIETVAQIARANPGLTEDWLNEKASSFIPDSVGGDPNEWISLIELGGVRIVAARPDVLLAMKLLAGRGRRDLPDIEALVEVCGCTFASDAEALFARFYPHHEMSARARAWLEQNLDA